MMFLKGSAAPILASVPAVFDFIEDYSYSCKHVLQLCAQISSQISFSNFETQPPLIALLLFAIVAHRCSFHKCLDVALVRVEYTYKRYDDVFAEAFK
jgi:hypothetical protein